MDDVGRLCIGLAIFIIASIILGFFTACTNSLLRIPDNRLLSLTEKGDTGKRLKKILKNPSMLIQTNLAVRCLTLILAAALGTAFVYLPICQSLSEIESLGKVIGEVDYIIVCVVFAFLLIVICALIFASLAVTVPKKLCKINRIGEKFALSRLGTLRVYLAFFKPLYCCFSLCVKATLRLLGVKTEDLNAVTESEIRQLLDEANSDGGIEEDQAEMISNIFEFSDMELKDVMTHRVDIEAVAWDAPVEDAVKIALESGFSRIPVYKESIDEICGVIYIKDLLSLILNPDGSEKLSDFVHEVKYVPDSANCSELFDYFTENSKQIAVLLDEYGGTAGIVTMEDLLECIVGSIRDEYDENEAEEIDEITPNTFDISGTADTDEVLEAMGQRIDSEHDYSTISGFVTDLLGYIPEDGQTPVVRWKNITFAVMRAKDNRIEKIRAVKDKEIEYDEEMM
ncbi:MAG: hemolysin family protein [Ruminococcus sp.]|nr:hemolysin family protein [Ruminococcus sp.]